MKSQVAAVAASIVLSGGPASAAVLLATGIAADDAVVEYSLEVPPFASDRYRLTLMTDRPMSFATFSRTQHTRHWQWDENAYGWYDDGLRDAYDECVGVPIAGVICADGVTWDPGPQTTAYFLSATQFVGVARAPKPFGRSFVEGLDDANYEFPGNLYLGAVVEPGTTYRIYGAEIPEPSSWAMLVVGIGLAGAALRARTRGFAPS